MQPSQVLCPSGDVPRSRGGILGPGFPLPGPFRPDPGGGGAGGWAVPTSLPLEPLATSEL